MGAQGPRGREVATILAKSWAFLFRRLSKQKDLSGEQCWQGHKSNLKVLFLSR